MCQRNMTAALPIASLLAVLSASASASAVNLAPNGDFERGQLGALPEGWTYVAWTDGNQFNRGQFAVELSAEVQAGSGKQCLKITGANIRDAGKEMCRAGAQSPAFVLAPNTSYKISFFYKTQTRMLQQGYPPAFIYIAGKLDKRWKEKWFDDTKGTWRKVDGVFHHLGPREEVYLQVRNYADGEMWFDQLVIEPVGDASIVEVDGRTYAIDEHKEDHPAATFSDKDKSRGYVLFSRDNPAGIYPNSYPGQSEIIEYLRTFATPGEYEPVNFAVYPLKDLEAVKVEVTDLVNDKGDRIDRQSIDVRSVKCWIQAVARGYQVVPELLERVVRLNLKAKAPQQYWLTVHVPPQAPAGRYTGEVIITTEDGRNSRIQLGLRVLPFTLIEQLPYPVGCWACISGMSGSSIRPVHGRYSWDEIPRRFRDMKEHGMNAMVWDYPEATFDYRLMGDYPHSKKVRLDFSVDNKIVELYKQAGLAGPIVIELTKFTTNLAIFLGLEFPASYYRDGNKGSSLQMPESEAPPEYIEGFKEGVRQIYQNAKEHNWPPVILHINDEPAYQGMQVIEAAAAQYRWAKEVAPQVTTWCVLKTNDEQIIRLFSPNLDIVQNYVSGPEDAQTTRRMLKEGAYKQRWGYTGPGNVEINAYTSQRLASGFKFKKSRAMTGMFYWGYGHMGQQDGKGGHLGHKDHAWDPYVDIPVKHISFSYRCPKDGSVVPTLAWEGVREGLDDARYIVTLEQLIEKGRASNNKQVRDEALFAEKMLEEIYDAVPWKVASIDWWEGVVGENVPDPQMSRYRWRVTQRIMKLSDVLRN